MKNIYLLVLSFSMAICHAQLPNLYACNGINSFDLTSQDPILLGSNAPQDYSISYHLSLMDANAATNPIENATNFSTSTLEMTIFSRFENNNNGTFLIDSFTLYNYNFFTGGQPDDITSCDSYILNQSNEVMFYFSSGGINPIPSLPYTFTESTTIYIVHPVTITCSIERSFEITILNSNPVPELFDVSVTNSYSLPPLSVGNYYTGPYGTGTMLSAGDIITTSQLIYVFSDTGFCQSETSFFVEVTIDDPGEGPGDNEIIEWQKTYGGIHSDQPSRIKSTSDLGYIVVGRSNSLDGDVTQTNVDPSDIAAVDNCWIVKLNQSGAIEWQKTIGGSNLDYASDVVQLPDGGYVVVGGSTSSDAGFENYHNLDDAIVVRFDSAGTILWKKAYGGSSNDAFESILITPQGNLLLLGQTQSNDGDVSGNHDSTGNTYDIWAVEINSSGSIVWQKCYGGTGQDYGKKIVEILDGGFAIGGSTTSTDGDFTASHGMYDYVVIKINAVGTLQWQTVIGGENQDFLHDFIACTDGGYLLSGSAGATGMLSKLDENGTIQWEKNGNYTLRRLVENDTFFMGIGSIANLTSGTESDVVMCRITSTGIIFTEDHFGGSSDDFGTDLQLTADGGMILCAATNSNDGDIISHSDSNTADFWVVKLTPNETLANPKSNLASIVSYPNPVRNILTISNSDRVETISVYNLFSQRLLKHHPNTSSAEIYMENLNSGIYLVKVEAENGEKTIKIIKE